MSFASFCKTTVLLGVLLLGLSSANAAQAPGGPGVPGTWGWPAKDGFGTTLTRPLWYTVVNGALSEVHFPLVDRLQSRDTFLIIRVGDRYFDERWDFEHRTYRIPGTLSYEVTSESSLGKITKRFLPSPDRNVLTIEYSLNFRFSGDYELILIHNPAAENTPGGDSLRVVTDTRGEPLLVAQQIDLRGDEPETLSRPSLQGVGWNLTPSAATVGFEGNSSPEDLIRKRSWPATYTEADFGNVAGALSWTGRSRRIRFDVVLAFSREFGNLGGNPRSEFPGLEALVNEALMVSANQNLNLSKAEWDRYLAPLKFDRNDPLEEASILVLKALEDKTYRGALIAAPAVPSLPWTWEAVEQDYESSRRRIGDSNAGYNRVWPRDLYQKALSLIAVEDYSTAIDIVRHFKRTQKSEGWWSQNMWADGSPSWGAMQLDQATFPITLVMRLVELGKIEYVEFEDMVNRAARYTQRVGPWTDQERWEEISGLSPNTLAVAVEGLQSAAWLERRVGRIANSDRYLRTAAHWASNFKTWALIPEGFFGRGYFARIERGTNRRNWNPSFHELFPIANKAPGQQVYFTEDQILDGGFLQWILSGLVDPMDPDFSRTIALYDRYVRKLTSAGSGYLRYNNDAYGDKHHGGAWPLLSAERAIAAIERGEPYQEHYNYVVRSGTSANMIGEQDTMAVRPLGWSHAAYLLLKRSVQEGRSFYIPKWNR